MFNILGTYHVQYENRIGIIGVGKMGRLAIEFAARLGCEVVVFSRTEEKRKLAMTLGASEYYATTCCQYLEIAKPIFHLLITTSVSPDWSLYIPLLAPGAIIYPLNFGAGTYEIPAMEILFKSLRIQGSLIASNKTAVKMLDFAAKEGISPKTKAFELDTIGIKHALWWIEQEFGGGRAVLVAREESVGVENAGPTLEKMKPCYLHKEWI